MNGHQKQREQSGKMIQEALFDLMKKKRFAEISVSEIVKKADVARRTFYRLYEGKTDVLRVYLEKLCREYSQTCKPLKDYDIRQISGEYFGFWYQHREFLLLMHRCGLDDVLCYEINRGSGEVIKQRIGSSELQREPGLEFFVSYSAGGFLNLLYRWILSGMQEAPEQYAGRVAEALLKFTKSPDKGEEDRHLCGALLE